MVLLPRGRTFPRVGSMLTPVGFSVAQVSVTDCPGLMDSGCAVNFAMRAGNSAALAYDGAGLGAGAGAGGVWPKAAIVVQRTATRIRWCILRKIYQRPPAVSITCSALARCSGHMVK